jgi:hypothetical protein
MAVEWISPEHEDTHRFFTTTRRKIAQQGMRPCKNCRGLRYRFLINPSTQKPFKVPCMACNA